jgi:hypothetical protein
VGQAASEQDHGCMSCTLPACCRRQPFGTTRTNGLQQHAPSVSTENAYEEGCC